MTFLGIDIGTTAVRALLVDESESIRAEADFPLAATYSESGGAEQNPEECWIATLAAIDGIRSIDAKGFAALRGIGVVGQPSTMVIVDDADRAIRPAMTWNDARAVNQAVLLDRQVPELMAMAGAAASPAATAAKLLWLRENEPENFARIAFVLSAKDFIRLRLTGEHATDLSDAATTLLLAETGRDWSPITLAASGVTRAALPTLLEGPAWSGFVLAGFLADWGIGHQVVVAAGASGPAAAAVGMGAINEGDAFISLEAAAQPFVARRSYRALPHDWAQAFAHAVPERWFDTVVPANAFLSLEWLAGYVGAADSDQLIARLPEIAAPCALLYVPDVAGERAPFSDPQSRGAFSAVADEQGEREMTQAVLEGIAFRLHDALDALGQTFPSGPVAVSGEGVRSTVLLSILASVLDRPLLRVANAERGTTLGAARLGRMAATGELAASVAVAPALVDIVDPVPVLSEAYAKRRADFRAFASSLRQVNESRTGAMGRRRRARG
jgi:xylulokinase